MGSTRNNLVRLKPKRQFGLFEDLVALGNQLHSKGLLPQVIISFDDDTKQAPGFEACERRILLYSVLLLLGSLQENLVVIAIVEEVHCLGGRV